MNGLSQTDVLFFLYFLLEVVTFSKEEKNDNLLESKN